MVMPRITDDEYPAAAGAETEEGRRPTLGVPGMGTGLEVRVLCGVSW